MGDACCVPGGRENGEPDAISLDAVPAGGGSPPATLVEIPAATVRVGDDSIWAYTGDGEGPVHEVELGSFRIDRYTVANSEFAKFVDATGWRTDAERYGWSFVFAGLLPDNFPEARGVVGAEWWRQVFDANWRQPEGPHTNLTGRENHPAVHVSWNDASAFCRWTGTRLPTEAEWECAARGGIQGRAFPWGDELEPDGEHRMNVFQGRFPIENTGADGFLATAPIDAYKPNGFGLYNVTGNVWEWCNDWLDVDYYAA